ncbi:hypothetical protein ACJX0J_015183 [Zea mays]
MRIAQKGFGDYFFRFSWDCAFGLWFPSASSVQASGAQELMLIDTCDMLILTVQQLRFLFSLAVLIKALLICCFLVMKLGSTSTDDTLLRDPHVINHVLKLYILMLLFSIIVKIHYYTTIILYDYIFISHAKRWLILDVIITLFFGNIADVSLNIICFAVASRSICSILFWITWPSDIVLLCIYNHHFSW